MVIVILSCNAAEECVRMSLFGLSCASLKRRLGCGRAGFRFKVV